MSAALETPPRRPFLTAHWSHLAILSWAIPRELISAYLPPGCEPDERDGRCFASLVAFDFLDTRVWGVAWPGYRSFPEVNLRIYVRYGEARGVAFVRELVPKRLIAWLARAFYAEPYAVAPMDSRVERRDTDVTVTHTVRHDGRVNVVHLECDAQPTLPAEDSVEHFFKEHRWGFGTTRSGRLVRYEVVHPTWSVLNVRDCHLDWDFRAVYGGAWALLDGAAPDHVTLAIGSDVRVFPRIREPADA